jgi:hypothetical protein
MWNGNKKGLNNFREEIMLENGSFNMSVGAFEFHSVAPSGDTDRCSLKAEICLHADNS